MSGKRLLCVVLGGIAAASFTRTADASDRAPGIEAFEGFELPTCAHEGLLEELVGTHDAISVVLTKEGRLYVAPREAAFTEVAVDSIVSSCHLSDGTGWQEVSLDQLRTYLHAAARWFEASRPGSSGNKRPTELRCRIYADARAAAPHASWAKAMAEMSRYRTFEYVVRRASAVRPPEEGEGGHANEESPEEQDRPTAEEENSIPEKAVALVVELPDSDAYFDGKLATLQFRVASKQAGEGADERAVEVQLEGELLTDFRRREVLATCHGGVAEVAALAEDGLKLPGRTGTCAMLNLRPDAPFQQAIRAMEIIRSAGIRAMFWGAGTMYPTDQRAGETPLAPVEAPRAAGEDE